MDPLFPPAWFAAGVITTESADYFVRRAAKESGRLVRHWRWAAFRDWSEEHEPLTAEQCAAVYALGEREEDANLGAALMCHALYCRCCPPEVRERATASDRPAVRRVAARR